MANEDIAVLAQKVYELSTLPLAELDARKVEAFLIVNNIYSSATKEGVAKANADKAARFGAQIEKEGLLAALHPKWHLRTDDGKPPAAKWALESALNNPHRNLLDRLATLLLIPPGDRPQLRDLALALAEFQDSCRLAIQACLALDFEHPLSYSGLRQTTRTGCQLRVFPDQRSGWRWRAAS